MGLWLKIGAALTTTLLLSINAAPLWAGVQESTVQATEQCMRCHGMATLSYRSAASGSITHLYVDPERYEASSHQQLGCIECHSKKLQTYPHPVAVKGEALHCLGCHQDGSSLSSDPFSDIGEAFKQSIHALRRPEEFDCFSCHNPHRFKKSRTGERISSVVRKDNRRCTGCHSVGQTTRLSNKAPSGLVATHQWLPNPLLHWRSVRCIECHAPSGSTQSHQLLSAEQSIRACHSCHAKNSSLLNSLYQYRSEEELVESGVWNKAAFNNAYVIGLSRNPTMDRWAALLLLLIVVVLLLHAIGRLWFRKKGGQ